MAQIKTFFHKILLFLYYFFFGADSAPREFKIMAPDPRFPGFFEFYKTNILPKAETCEQIRISNLKKFIFRCRLYVFSVIALTAIFIFALSNNLSHDQEKVIAQTALVIATFSFYWVISILIKFQIEIKKTLYEEIFSFLNLSYEALGSQDISAYEPSLIIPNYDEKISSTEDLVVGNHNGIGFIFEEMHLVRQVGSGKNRRKETTFKGCIIKLKFNKIFSGQTVLRKDLGRIRNFSYKFDLTRQNLQKVNLEDVDFENMFEIYSSDQIEARYLLTTSFMERLKQLSDFFATKKIEASFFENSLLISFDKSVNLFEINSIFEEIDIASEVAEVLHEISLIYDLINSLKLNQKITL